MLSYQRNIRSKIKKKRILQFYFFHLIIAYMFIAAVTFYILNYTQPAPMVDEIFHIPQAISFIQRNFSQWDPKITTLPGLYLFTSAVFNVIAYVGEIPLESLCQPSYLRLFNLVISIYMLHSIYYTLTFDDFSSRKVLSPKRAFWVTLNMSIFPVAYFFNHFYYTDTLSTLLVLMMYRQHLRNNIGKAAILGISAVMVRQTNIIWVGYLIIDGFFHSCQKILRKKSYRYRYLVNPIRVFSKLLEEKLLMKYLRHFFKNTNCYFFVCVMFVVFVYYNGGIVVGDKDAHVPVVHLCQLFYYSLFMLIFGFPHFVSFLGDFFNAIIKNKKASLISLITCLAIIHFNTMAHPYLLADNRHYTFYFWKRVYEKHYLTKYLLAPVYLFGFYAISKSLNMFKIAQFWICTFFCLVPQRLLELRYFIIPYFMLRLEISFKSPWSTIIELCWFALINCLMIYTFATKEFFWPDSPAIQRIIW